MSYNLIEVEEHDVGKPTGVIEGGGGTRVPVREARNRPEREQERNRRVESHVRFDSTANQQDLFKLDQGDLEELARRIPNVELKKKVASML